MVEHAADLVQRDAFLPAVPHLCNLRLGLIDPRSLLHQQHYLLYSQSLGVATTD